MTSKLTKGRTYTERNGIVSGRWEIRHRWTTGSRVYVYMVLVTRAKGGRGLPRFYGLTRRVVVRDGCEAVLGGYYGRVVAPKGKA